MHHNPAAGSAIPHDAEAALAEPVSPSALASPRGSALRETESSAQNALIGNCWSFRDYFKLRRN
jgi:hypothetical protein